MFFKKSSFIFLSIILLIISFSLLPINTFTNSLIVDIDGLEDPIIANHSIVHRVRLDLVPESVIIEAKNTLQIAYGHTSHGSQIIDGMSGLSAFKESLGGTEDLYDWNEGGIDGTLDIDDYFVSGDLGNPDRTTWASLTRDYLDNPANSEVNVVMWSWCGQVSSASVEDIETYLNLMSDLEIDYPDIYFIYMTGHVDGGGLEGNLHLRNEQIRNYCYTYNKILFDFADIESYDPEGSYFGDKYVTDNCDYDSNEDGDPWNDGANWAIEWQDTHPGEWYDCGAAHSQSLNANQKAYAIWWLWARLSGWEDNSTYIYTPNPTTFTPTGFTSFIGGYISLALVLTVAFTVIVLVERRKKFMD
ncbi:MAG TPA: hypothetical protein VMX55_06905 [candidate division Zixibacteria bacterium]|nr:hypothetical protein [candidate division Zixibacteria bacterium]